jgi:tetratricopeptide (TPR) repeat protein
VRRFAGVLLTVALVLALAAAASGALTREQALEALAQPDDADKRRDGARGLAETGTMADVPVLARALRDADTLVRALAERAMWQVWSRSGDPETDRLFTAGLAEMTQQHGEAAVAAFTRVVERQPDFAEGWNKRATVYYLLGQYEKSLADCDEVMKRNPYHFGALSGYGMIYLQLRDPERALEFFERALRVNPNLDSVQETVDALRALLVQRRRDSI